MFRQRVYNETEDNLLEHRLEYLCMHNIDYEHIKFYEVNSKAWLSATDITGYKIQKEILCDDTLIFYIYKGDI